LLNPRRKNFQQFLQFFVYFYHLMFLLALDGLF
jgi:hypothetical protein